MSYIGAEPTTAAFPFDQFSGTGAATSFTLTYAPASATSILVAISGVMQNPNLYSVIGTTLSFSPAPPAGTNNISVLYLGLPVIGSSSPGNTAFLSSTDLTATAGQTVFASAGSYTPGFVQVYRNGARLGNADFTATNGTTITLASAAASGDLVTIEYYTLTSLVNALPLTGGTVTGSTTFNSAVTINGAAVSGFTGMKNRIINGDMRINQRGSTATTLNDAVNFFVVDRFTGASLSDGAITGEQSTDAPAGFTNSIKYTVTTADSSLSAAQYVRLYYQVEGLNVSDFAWGSSSAATVTLSFWTKSSVTGTFGGTIQNSARDRSYAFSYIINSTNTWEQKNITIAGDQSGTWLKDNSVGLRIAFGLAAGSNYQQSTTNTWQSTGVQFAPSTALNLLATNGATWQVTGVQLERGSNATSFEFIDYGRQLIQCQRYYYRKSSTSSADTFYFTLLVATTTSIRAAYQPPVSMRSLPTMAVSNVSNFYAYDGSVVPTITGISTGGSAGDGNQLGVQFTVSGGGLTVGRAALLISSSATAWLEFSSEL